MRSRNTAGKTAVLVLGHGSQATHVEQELEKISQNVARETGLCTVAASLQFSKRTISTAIKELYDNDHRHVIIAPLFLFKGNHILKDIPEWLERELRSYPDLTTALTEPIGSDLRVAETLSSRVQGVLASSMKSTRASRSTAIAKFLDKRPVGIEKESFRLIHDMLRPYKLSKDHQKVIYRMIHASGDPGIISDVRVSDDLLEQFSIAVRGGAAVYCDVKMVSAGISAVNLKKHGLTKHIFVDDDDVVARSKRSGQTRAMWALKKAYAELGNNVILVIGNSPTALFAAIELADKKKYRPRAVIGTPVGFVGAKEAKMMLAASDVPHITINGFKGGSAIAAAAFNGAMLTLNKR